MELKQPEQSVKNPLLVRSLAYIFISLSLTLYYFKCAKEKFSYLPTKQQKSAPYACVSGLTLCYFKRYMQKILCAMLHRILCAMIHRVVFRSM